MAQFSLVSPNYSEVRLYMSCADADDTLGSPTKSETEEVENPEQNLQCRHREHQRITRTSLFSVKVFIFNFR